MQNCKKGRSNRGKILGAGVGGYFLFYCEPEDKLRLGRSLAKAGAAPEWFNFDHDGLQTWKVGEKGVVS